MKTIQAICDIRQEIQNFVDSHADELEEAFLSCDASHDDVEKIKSDYEEKVYPYRQLHVGIVGRVKAGKSSLLNSLFFDGKEILPKAATPMTAALTKLYYSPELNVKINFFNAKDIDDLEKATHRYEKILKSKIEEKKIKQIEIFKRKNGDLIPSGNALDEIVGKARKSALSDLKTENFLLCGEAEQYELYQKSDAVVKAQLGKYLELKINDISELEGKLSDYVGANGRFTAITSNVEIGIPNKNLKDIIVVDTPGFDDPVASRDALARDALKICDAIFVLSPSGSFCNIEDRSNISKIEKGEGIQEIFVVASQIDNALCAPEYIKKNINENLTNIVLKISGTLNKMLDGMEKDEDISLSLIKRIRNNTGNNLLFTSGIVQSIVDRWERKSDWNEELQFVYERMKNSYPDYFSSEDDSSKAILERIGNISVIRNKMDEVKSRKDEILKKREEEYLSAKYEGLKDIVNTLSENINVKKAEIQNGDLGQLEEEKNRMNENFDKLKSEFIDSFDEEIEKFTASILSSLTSHVDEFFENKQSDINKAIETENRIQTYQVEVPYFFEEDVVEGTGFLNFISFGLLGHHTENRIEYNREERARNVVIHTVNAHAVTSAIKEFADSVGFNLEQNAEQMKTRFKKNLKSLMLGVWSKYEILEYCSNSSRAVQAGQIVNTLPEISFKLNWQLPSNLSRKGKLEGDDAYDFEESAADALSDIRRTYFDEIQSYVKTIRLRLDSVQIANTILEKMRNSIGKLTEQIINKKEVVFKLSKLSDEIERLKSDVVNT